VLYAKGTVNVPAPVGQNTALGITFTHRLARVGVEINTMGMFADIENLGVTVSGLAAKTATINLRTGALSNLVAYEPTLDFTSFENVEEPYADAKIGYVYTAEVGTSNVVVTLNKLQLKIDDGSSRSFDQLLTATPSTFTFNSLPRRLGASFTARVNMIESPLTLGSVRWARQNLYYIDGHNPYRFQHTSRHSNDRNSYFSFRGLTPENYSTSSSDPCTEVYPRNTWRQPTVNELTALSNANPSFAAEPDGKRYFQYAASGTAGPYGSNTLRFNMNGQGAYASLVSGLINLNYNGTYGNTASYWSYNAAVDVPLLGTLVGAYSIENASGNSLIVGTNLLNIRLLGGLSVIESDFKNVRCVRQ